MTRPIYPDWDPAKHVSPMTAEDYKALGMEAPPSFCKMGYGCEMYGICCARAQGRPDMCDLTIDTKAERCEECGDENQGCSCLE